VVIPQSPALKEKKMELLIIIGLSVFSAFLLWDINRMTKRYNESVDRCSGLVFEIECYKGAVRVLKEKHNG